MKLSFSSAFLLLLLAPEAVSAERGVRRAMKKDKYAGYYGKGYYYDTDDHYKSAKSKSKKSHKGSNMYSKKSKKSPGKGGDSGGGGYSGAHFLQPPLPGIQPGADKPKLILAQDVDFPPMATLGPEADDFPMAGFTVDFAMGMQDVCDIDVSVVQTQWVKCWDSDRIGDSLSRGDYHGCSSYVQTSGVRNRYLEFSNSILDDVQPAGILTRLENGVPVVDGNSDLSGVSVVDVIGFAPTEDNLALVYNGCTDEKFFNYNVIGPDTVSNFPPDDALKTLLDGSADAMWTTADMVERYNCDTNPEGPQDCSIWGGLGDTFAWIQVGMSGWARNGTTLTTSKIGSGVPGLVNPCIAAFLETEAYYDICVKNDLVEDCYPNQYFPDDVATAQKTWEMKTSDLTTTCADGYCPCP